MDTVYTSPLHFLTLRSNRLETVPELEHPASFAGVNDARSVRTRCSSHADSWNSRAVHSGTTERKGERGERVEVGEREREGEESETRRATKEIELTSNDSLHRTPAPSERLNTRRLHPSRNLRDKEFGSEDIKRDLVPIALAFL